MASVGPGSGGALATIRFDIGSDGDAAREALADLANKLARLPLLTGVHVALSDDAASGVKTAESRDRSDIQAPPSWILLVEACAAEALEEAIRQTESQPIIRRPRCGRYVLEYTRLKTDWSPG